MITRLYRVCLLPLLLPLFLSATPTEKALSLRIISAYTPAARYYDNSDFTLTAGADAPVTTFFKAHQAIDNSSFLNAALLHELHISWLEQHSRPPHHSFFIKRQEQQLLCSCNGQNSFIVIHQFRDPATTSSQIVGKTPDVITGNNTQSDKDIQEGFTPMGKNLPVHVHGAHEAITLLPGHLTFVFASVGFAPLHNLVAIHADIIGYYFLKEAHLTDHTAQEKNVHFFQRLGRNIQQFNQPGGITVMILHNDKLLAENKIQE